MHQLDATQDLIVSTARAFPDFLKVDRRVLDAGRLNLTFFIPPFYVFCRISLLFDSQELQIVFQRQISTESDFTTMLSLFIMNYGPVRRRYARVFATTTANSTFTNNRRMVVNGGLTGPSTTRRGVRQNSGHFPVHKPMTKSFNNQQNHSHDGLIAPLFIVSSSFIKIKILLAIK
uniref:Uncharacterized protein n=1 Tax=Panagrolaimus sp. JU765 TaxID=591449 RepID=A0AC34Q4J2_9BILA